MLDFLQPWAAQVLTGEAGAVSLVPIRQVSVRQAKGGNFAPTASSEWTARLNRPSADDAVAVPAAPLASAGTAGS